MVVKKAQRLPVPKSALPDFTPVPRKQPRHDGWTPERQRAFVEALADTGCVKVAARAVNMAHASAYQLRRQPGAEGFRAAWDAAQTLGLQAVRDEAFDRAMNGELIPVFVAGKLMGFRRKKNDRLLMFILRHYGQDAQGRKTTINYFSTRATAGAAAATPSPLAGEGDSRSERGEGAAAALAAAESSTTTVKTVITGPHQSTTLMGGISGSPTAPSQLEADASAANLVNAFAGVDLDPQAQAEIYRALESAAERRRALEATPEHDPDGIWIGEAETNGYLGQLESGFEGDWIEYRPAGEHRWEGLGEGGAAAEIDAVLAGIEARKASMTPEEIAAQRAAEEAMARAQHERQSRPSPGCIGGGTRALPAPEPDADDPRFDWRNWQTGSYAPPQNPPRNGEGDRSPKANGGGAAAPAPDAGEPPEPSSAHPEPLGSEVEGPEPVPAQARKGRTHSPRKRSPEHAPSEACLKPVEGQGRRTYKKRQPKPRFTAPDEATYEARKAEAVVAVEAERRVAAEAEAERRKARSRRA